LAPGAKFPEAISPKATKRQARPGCIDQDRANKTSSRNADPRSITKGGGHLARATDA